MFCEKCGNQLNDGAAFCPRCGHPVMPGPGAASVPPNAPLNAMANVPPNAPANNSSSTKKVLVIIGVVVVLFIVGIIVLLKMFLSKTEEVVEETPIAEYVEEDELTRQYKQYLGTWKCAGDIMHPDGMLHRVGSYIYFTEDGIDSSDALGSNRRWYALEDLQYYNTDGDDYFVYVDGVYDIGFKFVSEDNQIIVFTPSGNYPSSDPYNWNDRLRFEKESD